jgi:glycosyltransferase involved in cell wall biosynthesis
LRLGPGPVVFSPRGLKDIYNPEVVLTAFARVRTKFPNSHLMLKHAGDATQPAAWDEAAGIHLIGHLEREKVAELFRAADVTVSIPSSDSSPRSVWEAMASGSATVLSNLPWVKELIVDGRDALVVEPQAEAVALAIERLWAGDRERERIATSARKLVERHRNRDVELARIETCYRELARH